METKAALNAGDVCLDCQQKGLEKYLRYFKINLNGDVLLKCESNECMFPYNDELCSSDDDDRSIDNVSQTNSLKLINELIEQFDNEEEVQDTLSHVPISNNVSEQVAQFDITFLDDLNTADNENLCKAEITDEKNEFFVNELNNEFITNNCVTVPETKISLNFQLPELNFTDEDFKTCSATYQMSSSDNIKDSKVKINIQSIETLKYESPFNNELPTSSNNLPITQVLYAPLEAAADKQKNFSKPLRNEQKPNKINKNKLKSQTTTLYSSTKSHSFDIPKADILKANALLKNLAMIEANEKSPKINRKCKKVRTKDSKKKVKIEKFNEPETSSSSNNDSNYSFDKIAKMLIANSESKQ